MKMQANSGQALGLVPLDIANHVNVVNFESELVPTHGGLVGKHPHHLIAKELKVLDVKDDYLPTFLKWARPSARLSEGKTIFDRARL
jgi:hypothetical protein